jgi:hypothetical protein
MFTIIHITINILHGVRLQEIDRVEGLQDYLPRESLEWMKELRPLVQDQWGFGDLKSSMLLSILLLHPLLLQEMLLNLKTMYSIIVKKRSLPEDKLSKETEI